MEIILVLAILVIALIANYIQKLYYARTEQGKSWVQCYRCKGEGSIRGDRYGTNGVEIWPLYDTCPTCKGRGKIEKGPGDYILPELYCPKCHLLLAIKIAEDGPHQGKKFLTCPNHKKCKVSLPMK